MNIHLVKGIIKTVGETAMRGILYRKSLLLGLLLEVGIAVAHEVADHLTEGEGDEWEELEREYEE